MEKYLVNPHLLGDLHYEILKRVDSLTDQERQVFCEIFELKKKNTFSAYLFCIFLGAHYAYLNQWGIQIALWISVICFVGLFWVLIDMLFRIPRLIKLYNDNIAINIINNLPIGNNTDLGSRILSSSQELEHFSNTNFNSNYFYIGVILWSFCAVFVLYILFSL